MIDTVWPYLAIMLLAAGVFPSLERRFQWRFFSVLPPIVRPICWSPRWRWARCGPRPAKCVTRKRR